MNTKLLIIIPIVLGIVILGVAIGFSGETFNGILLSEENQEWKSFTDNLELIEYKHNEIEIVDLKDKDGIWIPTQEEFKEVYKYVYGYNLVPWQKMDGTEMSPLQCKLKDGKEIIKPNGKCELERINLIPQWEQEWNNNVEIGEFNKDVLKELRKDTKQGMINSDIDESKIINKKEKKNYFAWLKKLIKIVYAAVEFSDTFTEGSDVILSGGTPDTGSGWSLVQDNGSCNLWIDAGTDTLDAAQSRTSGGCADNEGSFWEIDDNISTADMEVSVLQTNGDTGDDKNHMGCRVKENPPFGFTYYFIFWNEADADLFEITEGSIESLDLGIVGIADGSTVKLICDGTSISVEDDDVEILSGSDASNGNGDGAGLGIGDIWNNIDNNADVSTQRLNNFTAGTISAEPPADTCTPPASGDWTVDLSDNCYVTTDTYITGNLILLDNQGSGCLNIIDGAVLSVTGWEATSTRPYICLESDDGSELKTWTPI